MLTYAHVWWQVEDAPYARVRALRCNMGDDTVVKETSEKIILTALKKDMGQWIK